MVVFGLKNFIMAFSQVFSPKIGHSLAKGDPEQIEEQIAAQILRGELASGTCLPPIRTVALEMRISVITVKKAWEELERRGLIATITGKGCFVRELPAGELDDKRAETALERLRKDLELVDDDAPIVVCLHIPAWNINSDFSWSPRLDNTYSLSSILNRYSNVHIVSGHNHGNYTLRATPFSHITEHNIAAVCGSLWQSAVFTGHHICHDGSPAGYMRWTINDDDMQWYFKPIHEGERQMRLYDMNTVRDYYRDNATMRNILHDYPSRVNYGIIDDNVVMVNVFSYGPGWQVTICEDDSVLPCERVYTEDPFHTLAYDVACYSVYGNYSTYYTTSMNTHMFKAQAATATKPIVVRAIDPFGNSYLQIITRPHKYVISMESSDKTLLAGDVNADGEINIADVNTVVEMLIGLSRPACPILADSNADGEINIADINMIIDLILKP